MLKNKLISAVSAALLSSSLALPSTVLAADYSTSISLLVNYLKANQGTNGGITGWGGETSWTIMGLASVGIDPDTVENGGNSLLDFLAANPPADTTVTGWERDLLAVTAAGKNPFTFGSRNYVSKVESFANNNQLGSTTSVSDDFWGILALISAGPSANQEIIFDSVDFVIANQNGDGGWGYNVGGPSDNADTAIALQALQAAKGKGFTNAGLDNALNDGLTYLKGNQNADGGWGYAGTGFSDAGSTAWSVLAVLNNDDVVEAALNFISTKQDATSGGVDGGWGVDTYTSANSLIAFGRTSFPVKSFTGTFEEPEPEPEPVPDQTQNNSWQNNQNQNNNPGQVLATTNSPGQVLAANTLPDTGIITSQADLVPVDNYLPKPIEINKLLLIGLIALEVGLGLRLIAGRIRKNIVD